MAGELCEDDDLFQGDFNASLKQFIRSLEPSLKAAGSLAAAEDILTHLEATDENFHRYEFVRQLRNRISKVLSPVVADEFEKRALCGTDSQDTIPLVIEELLASPEYASLSQSILTSIKSSVKEMIESFDSSPDHQTWSRNNEYGKRQSADPIDEESSLSSSERMGYMFMSHEKLRSIVQKLDIAQSIETRHQALIMLSQIPQGDIVTSEQWSCLKKGLTLALGDQDQRLSDISLNLLSKMHIINNGHATREVFTCLTQHLMGKFQDRIQLLLDDGLDVTTNENQNILKRFRLLGEFLHEIPSYWVRYPERFVDDILESSISLLSLGNNYFGLSSFNGIISPLHYLALLDPKASWFKKWMHGYYSRKSVVEQLKHHPSLLIDAVSHCLEFSTVCKSLLPLDDGGDANDEHQFEPQTDEKNCYSSQQVDYIYFVHSLCMLGRLLLYHDGRELFPITLPDNDELQ